MDIPLSPFSLYCRSHTASGRTARHPGIVWSEFRIICNFRMPTTGAQTTNLVLQEDLVTWHISGCLHRITWLGLCDRKMLAKLALKDIDSCSRPEAQEDSAAAEIGIAIIRLAQIGYAIEINGKIE